MKKISLLAIVVLLHGCVQFSLIESKPNSIGNITVKPDRLWNKAPKQYAIFPGVPTWTIDGIPLNSLSFFSDIRDGKPIFTTRKKGEFPVFRMNMLPNEVIELVETTISKALNARIYDHGELNPVVIDGRNGFEYSFEFSTEYSPVSKAYLVAVIFDNQLQMILFMATKLHYYDNYINEVRELVLNASIK